jgi:hypothetical protein
LPGIRRLHPTSKAIMLINYSFPGNREKRIDQEAGCFFGRSAEFQKVAAVLKRIQSGSRVR